MRHKGLADMRSEQRRLIRLIGQIQEHREVDDSISFHDLRVRVTINDMGLEPVEISFSMHEVETQAARALGILTAEIMRAEGN